MYTLMGLVTFTCNKMFREWVKVPITMTKQLQTNLLFFFEKTFSYKERLVELKKAKTFRNK